MIDLDSFKLVNDIYGHNMGDKILIKFAELIKSVIRAEDLAGRMGGDEFTAFLQGVSDEKVLENKSLFLNMEILKTARKLLGEDMQIPLGVSIGAVFVPAEGRDFQKLYEKADKALYEVKQHGKHGISIYREQNRSGNKISVEGITQMRLILGERNAEGAYYVEFEDFKKIYRLLARMADAYKKNLILVQFALTENNLAEEFKEILITSLRKSDCVTQSGDKFLILLIETTLAESDEIKERILTRLAKNLREKISYEREKIC